MLERLHKTFFYLFFLSGMLTCAIIAITGKDDGWLVGWAGLVCITAIVCLLVLTGARMLRDEKR